MTQFIPAAIPAIDRNGQPAPGATWNFYAENTLAATPVVGGATTVTAGSNGVFPSITLDNAVTYRSILKTADGRVISDITSVIDRHFAAGVKEAEDGSELVPGALWKFYDAGTTTPRPVFADPDMTVSLGASVEADASARFPEIYLNSASAYKAVLERPDGTVLGTIDPVNATTMAIFLRETNPDGTYEISGVLYGPHYGPRGPTQIIIAPFNQGDTGYCYETNNVAENLPAKWAARGCNALKVGHPDSVRRGRATQLLANVEAAGLMLIAAPTWYEYYEADPNPELLDYRDLSINDAYFRTKWIKYQILDEIDLLTFPLSDHVDEIANWPLAGVTKPATANFTRRVAIPAALEGGAYVNFWSAFNVPELKGLSIDSYEWHLSASDANGATVTATSPDMWVSTWHGIGPYDVGDPNTKGMFGRRFTASVTGMASHLQRYGPVMPGRSDTGEMPVQYPPIAFNTPPFTVYGLQILPQAATYDAGDKATGHYVATGRVDVSESTSYPRAGQWQPGRFLRNESWSGFVHGSSALYLFPQTVGGFSVTGYVDAGANTFVATSPPSKPMIGGAMRVVASGGVEVGWITRDNPQVSGTPGSTGTYTLDPAKITPVTTGSSGTPVVFTLGTEARPWGDDTNAENLSELTNIIANLERMQAHPTGGNLLIDTAMGGRRAFTTMRCPDIDGDTSLYREDMTLAPTQAGYTSEGVAIADSGGGLPLWDYGWPMGFEGFRVTGDDGAVYIYVRSMSNSDQPTWFPGYAALGLPTRVFGPFELVGFRRVGSGSATEMTGTSAVIKAGVDDGAATWFYIETASVTQNEGNSGNTAYNFTIRRGGDLTGTDTVTATVSGTGLNPAAASDFNGGVFPTEVLSFAPSEATKTFTASVIGDTTAEFDETAKVNLSSPSTGTAIVGSNKSEALFSIVNDDAPLASTFIWLVNTDETSALALTGSPVGATYLKASEGTFVTRDGLEMRARGAPSAGNDGGFANVPYWLSTGAFSAIEIKPAPGNWEIGFIFSGNVSGNTLTVIDDPDGAANTRVSSSLSATSSSSLSDTDGTEYTNASTAVAGAVNNLTFTPVLVTDAGGGAGLIRAYTSGGGAFIAAVAIREV